jgi:pilus assembly protein FimV
MQADQVEQAEQEATEGIEEIETEAADAVGDAIQADEEALLEELLAEEAAAQAEEQTATEGKADDEMVSDEMVSEEATTEPAMVDEGFTEQAATDDAMAEDEAVTPPPAPVIVTEPVTRVPSIFDGILPPEIIDMIPSMGGLLGDPIILAAIGGVVLLLLILVVLKRRKGGSDDESGITVSGDDDLFAGEDDEELTPIHLADGVEPAAETDINLPVEEDSIVEEPTIEKPAAAPDEDLSATAGISPTEMPEPEAPAPAAASSEQDDVLNEVDVYLAYGLYDNAEELLNSNLAENPERADYRSKLLDTYFATKNTDSFVKEAEKLKSMGDVATG